MAQTVDEPVEAAARPCNEHYNDLLPLQEVAQKVVQELDGRALLQSDDSSADLLPLQKMAQEVLGILERKAETRR